MLGFFIGTACLIGLVKLARGSRCGYGYGYGGGCGGGDFGGPFGHRHGSRQGGFGFRGFGPRFFLRRLFERLDTTPGQEKVILKTAEELRDLFRKAKDEMRETRSEFARIFRGDVVDEATLQDIFVKHDTVISETRRGAVEAVRKAHEALTEEQRSQVADFLERGRGSWGRGRRDWI
jgi:Spy/CpxP family protein refolding chaperone